MKYLKFICYGIYMIWVRIKGIKRDYLHKFKGEDIAWRYGQEVFIKWSLFTIKIIGMDIRIEGKENIPDDTCVFMGNHQSILDIPLLRYSIGRPVDFVAKHELVKIPIMGYWITHLKSVALNRENVREGMKAINTAIANIKAGYTFAVFPEGTRSKDGNIKEFKKGSIKLATKAKVPIVPFALNGTSACFEDTRNFIPGKITIIFGEPLEVNNLSREEEKFLTEEVQGKVSELYNKILKL
ncbi:lysophospholipid acyltransferase family protein [Clostridium paraputrificum]|uniref:lysophospholipid acyltransferase family protein n=1 Tax=Clostridium TaxID=1485 RepID=UPI003D34FAA6